MASYIMCTLKPKCQELFTVLEKLADQVNSNSRSCRASIYAMTLQQKMIPMFMLSVLFAPKLLP